MEVLILLVIGGLGIGLAGAISIAWLNPGNKTIAISAAALFGAAFLFFIQLIFELRATEEKNIIPAGLIIDRAGSRIWGSRASSNKDTWAPALRKSWQDYANYWLRTNHPDVFKEDVTDSRVTDLRRLKLTHEFTIAEILYFFMENPESDWQLMEPLKGDIYPILKHRITGGTNLDAQKLKSVLLESGNGGNLFAGATMFTGSIRLPPKSVLKLKWNILTITNPFGSLTFVIVENPMVNLRKPGTTIAPKLSNGKYQFETRENVIVVINGCLPSHNPT